MRLTLAALTACIALSFSGAALAQERYAAIVIDAVSGESLHEDQADERRYPASLTKMMTLYLLFEAIESGDLREDDVLVASAAAARQPRSSLGVRESDRITVEDAIIALIVPSANDVATMVAERVGGSEARFAQLMTLRAQELGMADTRFANASGLPDSGQWTTARDMARLSRALWIDFPDYYCYFQSVNFSWNDTSVRSHNRLLWQVEGVDGIKTGYTRASGFNVATSAERNGRRLIAVVMGGESAAARDAQMAYLIEDAFEQYQASTPVETASFRERRYGRARLVSRRSQAGAEAVQGDGAGNERRDD